MGKKELDLTIKMLFLVVFGFFSNCYACTGIQLKAKDGAYVNARTVEFGISLNVGGLIIPRNYEFKGTLPDGGIGLIYRAKYAVVGGNMFQENAISDGLNEKGLSVGAFYFPDYAGYATITKQNKNRALSPTQFANWILTQFETIEEVKNGIQSVVIAPSIPKGWPTLPPFHYVVYDKSGKSVVIEPINGKFKVYDNPLGVITNSPTFDWHLTNLSNYINLSPLNAPSINVNGIQLKALGQGSGLRGMPGDFTSPSRFIRATLFTTTAIPSENSKQSAFQAFHILNQFDIPVGAVRDVAQHIVHPEYTMITSVKDPNQLIYYYKTFQDQTIRMINLNEFDLNANNLKTIDLTNSQTVFDMSKLAREKKS